MAEDKFKPRTMRDLDPSEKEIFQKIEYNWNEHPIVKNYHGLWREYIAFWEGDQYLFYNKYSDKLEDVTPLLEREIYDVCNRIFPMVRQSWGAIRYHHQFRVDPNTLEDEDGKAAKLGSMLLEFINNKTRFQQKVSLAKLWSLIVGDCYWKAWWNKNLTGMTLDKEHKAVEEKGEIDQDLVIPFNFRPDPDIQGRDTWRYALEGKRVPVSAVAEEFGIEPKLITADAKDKPDSGLFERIELHKSKEETVIRIEYYERPSKKYEKGRFVVKAGNYLGWDNKNPFPKADLPYFNVPGIIPILGEDQHDSIVRAGQPAQKQLNRAESLIDEHIQNFRTKVMIPEGSLVGKEMEIYTRAGFDYVKYNALAGGVPFTQQPAAIPQIVMDWRSLHEREIDAVTSVRDASLGRIPKYGTRASGTLFEGLRSQDEKVLLPGVEEQDQALCGVMKFILQLAIDHYSIPRMIKVTGRENRTAIEAIKGADLRNNTDVVVVPGVDLFTNKEQKQDVVMTFVEKGLITDKREGLELMDMKSMDWFMQKEFIDERQAYRENDMMREGKKYPIPSKWDNSEVHMKIHGDERKKEDFDLWSPAAKTMYEKHMSETEALLKPAPAPPAVTPGAMMNAGAMAPGPAAMPAAPAPIAAPPPAQSPEELALIAEMVAQSQGGGAPAPAGGI